MDLFHVFVLLLSQTRVNNSCLISSGDDEGNEHVTDGRQLFPLSVSTADFNPADSSDPGPAWSSQTRTFTNNWVREKRAHQNKLSWKQHPDPPTLKNLLKHSPLLFQESASGFDQVPRPGPGSGPGPESGLSGSSKPAELASLTQSEIKRLYRQTRLTLRTPGNCPQNLRQGNKTKSENNLRV